MMDGVKNSLFKGMMYILATVMLAAAIYVTIWKLATVLLLLMVMSPFAVAIIWKIKKTYKNTFKPAHNEPTNKPKWVL